MAYGWICFFSQKKRVNFGKHPIWVNFAELEIANERDIFHLC